MRLIDADALVAKLKTQYGEELGWQCIVNMSDVGMMVEDAPTVDAVEVVRCKDCKWYAPNNDGFWYGCTFDTRNKDDEPKSNDFCSYGEKKVSE